MKEDNNKKKKTKKKRKIKKGHIKKKLKTLYKQKIIRDFVIMLLVQIAIICLWVIATEKPIDWNETKTIDVTVDDTVYCSGYKRHSTYYVVSDGERYHFPNCGIFGKYPHSKLNKAIHIGDRLTITYYEDTVLFEKRNFVVAASSDTEAYITKEDYYNGYKGKPIISNVILSIVEVLFVGYVFLYISLHKEMLDFRK